jgi:large subunit ribosomal protein L31
MKTEIHPDYVAAHVRCTCGNEFTTRSTQAEIRVGDLLELPSVLHGQAEAGRHGRPRERFKRRAAKRARS